METKQVELNNIQLYTEGRETVLIDRELFDDLILTHSAPISKKALKERYAVQINSIAVFLTMADDHNYIEGLIERINMFIIKMKLDSYAQQLIQDCAEEKAMDGDMH